MEKSRQKRSILAILIALLLACSIAGLSVMLTRSRVKASAEVSVWDGDLIAAGWGDESVTAPDGYSETVGTNGKKVVTISSAAAFAWFAHEVYADSDHDLDGATVTLTTDIDLDNHMWIPIGQTARNTALAGLIRFSGTFDGGEHTVKNFNTEKYVSSLHHIADSEVDGVAAGDYQVYDYEEEYKGEENKGYTNTKAYIPFKAKGSEYSYGLFGIAYDITIKNLNVDNVKIDLKKMQPDSKEYLTDSIGAIVGYATGNIVIENCTVGSADHTDKNNAITLRDDDGGAAGGIIGRLYAYNGSGGAFTNFELNNCVNYLDIDTADSRLQTGGIVGLIDYGVLCKIEGCVNYGNINGGSHTGGIIGTWTPSNTDAAGKQTDYCWMFDCDNYGNIYSETATYVGGLIGEFYDNQCKTVKFIADGNVNYGNVGGKNRIGGVFGTTDPGGTGASIMKVITNNYNYGDVYSFNAESVGGYIGYDYSTSPKIYVVSGGNFGTIYGEASFKGQNYGGTGRIGSAGGPVASNGSVVEKVLTKRFLIAAGDMKDTFNTEDGMPAPKYSEPVWNRHSDAVSREVEDGKYKLSETNDLVYEHEYTDDTFAYTDAEHTTIIGIVNGTATITIPDTVTKIALAAFAGNTDIQVVKFAEDNKLTSIEDAAFAGCSKLNNVVLPSNAAGISVGAGIFSGTRVNGSTPLGALLIAKSSAEYQTLAAIENWEQSGGNLTYVVTMNYVVDGEKLPTTEERLHGQGYNVTLDVDGQWTGKEMNAVGPAGYNTLIWYTGSEGGYAVTYQNVNNLLLTDSDSITLYAFNETSGKVFIPLTGLVYDESKSYTVQEINSLLHALSDRIDTRTMTVTIEFEGDEVDVIHNAGDYEVSVVVPEDKTYTFTITIEKATLDLSNIANLEWLVKDTQAELMEGTLYIYTDKTTGVAYPSRELLTDAQIASKNLNNSYTVRTVEYSIARSRGEKSVTIEIAGNGYSVVYTNNSDYKNVATEVGAYTAYATLTTNGNYVFTKGNIGGQRHLTIDIDETGSTATVTKEWYIVDISNALLGANNAEYTITGHTYGGAVNAVAPRLTYGSDALDTYITMYLSYVGDIGSGDIGDASGFKVSEFAKYINNVMPAGTYTLRIVVGSVTTTERMDNGNEVDVVHGGFTQTYTFTVEKAELPSLTAVHGALNGQKFTFEDASAKMYDDAAVTAITNYVAQYANLDRTDTIWGDPNYDYAKYYGDYAIQFNLLRDHTDEYTATVDVSEADTYTVYYRIYAPNYYSSIDGVSRYDYSFELVKYHVVDLPNVSSDGLVYTGSRVVPTLTENSWYEIIWSTTDTYITGGTHSVSFKLYDTDHYRWAGHEDDGVFTISKDFTIAKAENVFTVSLNMLGWSFETFDAAVNNIRAAVRFLDEGETIHFRVVKKGETTALTGLEDFTIDENGKVNATVAALLNALRTGEYTLYASVAATGNYKALELNVDFAVSKAMNSWAVGDEDLVLPSWIVGRYDPEVNLIVVNAAHGTVNIIITDIDGNEYYNSVTGLDNLNELKVGKYLLKAWVEESDDYAELAERTFTIEVFKKVGLPWWATLAITVGALGIAALIIFILWKTGVFQIVTEKIVVALRTRASVEATIASVRAAKRMEEGKKSVAEAKRKERLEQMRQKAQEIREMSPEDRAAYFEAKAQVDAERAEKMRARSEAALARAAKARGEDASAAEQSEQSVEEPPATETSETPTEE